MSAIKDLWDGNVSPAVARKVNGVRRVLDTRTCVCHGCAEKFDIPAALKPVPNYCPSCQENAGHA